MIRLTYAEHSAVESAEPYIDAAVDYHETTKVTRTTLEELGARVGKVLSTPSIRAITKRSWKQYPTRPIVPLPRPRLPSGTLADALSGIRAPRTEPMSLTDLSVLLKLSYGALAEQTAPGLPEVKGYWRPTPSAGGMYPAEIYPVLFNVVGADPGLYHYTITDHSLALLRSGDLRDELASHFIDPTACASVDAAVVVSAVFPRTLSKYLYRGYVFVQYDVGALEQSLRLVATSLGLSHRIHGGFFDDELAAFTGIDGIDEAAMFVMALSSSSLGGDGSVDL